MNVPGIRAALERLDRSFMALQHHGAPHPVTAAVVRVGLRACDVAESACRCCPNGVRVGYHSVDSDLLVIADILREAGVEVEK